MAARDANGAQQDLLSHSHTCHAPPPFPIRLPLQVDSIDATADRVQRRFDGLRAKLLRLRDSGRRAGDLYRQLERTTGSLLGPSPPPAGLGSPGAGGFYAANLARAYGGSDQPGPA